MAKIVYVNVTLDDKTPASAAGMIRAGSVVSEDEEGSVKTHQEFIDSTEYRSHQELITAVAQRLGVSDAVVEIEK
jgi:hypothetical protein